MKRSQGRQMAADALAPAHIVNIAAAHPHAQDESFVRSSRPMLKFLVAQRPTAADDSRSIVVGASSQNLTLRVCPETSCGIA